MSKISKIPSVFLDRDGVLNKDIGYVHKASQINWIPGAKEAVALLKNQGYLVFVVTNQSGIARGLYTEDEVEHLHAWMNEELFRSGGSSIDPSMLYPLFISVIGLGFTLISLGILSSRSYIFTREKNKRWIAEHV